MIREVNIPWNSALCFKTKKQTVFHKSRYPQKIETIYPMSSFTYYYKRKESLTRNDLP